VWLTTVDTASREVGLRAARCLLERMAGAASPERVVLAAPGLEIRGTTGPSLGPSRSTGERIAG
jgi:DNA-binding LacI/PurR family transcriptional regulator